MAARSKVIGRVSVKVWPDTQDFKDRLKKQLAEAERESDLAFQPQLDERSLRHAALYALRDLNNDLRTNDRYKVKFNAGFNSGTFDNAVRQAHRGMQTIAASMDDIEFTAAMTDVLVEATLDDTSLDNVADDLRNWRDRISPLEVIIQPILSPGSTTLINKRLQQLTRPRVAEIIPAFGGSAKGFLDVLGALSGGRSTLGLVDEFADLVLNLDKTLPLLTAAGLGVANLAAVSLAGASSVASLTLSLAKIGPGALALPGILGGMTIALGASAIAFADFNKEIPQASAGFKEMRAIISRKFWDQARDGVAGFVNELMPLFSRNIGNTASGLGGFFGGLADDLQGALGPAITDMFADLNESIDIASDSTSDLAGIITTLGSVGSRQLPELARWFRTSAASLRDFLSEAEDSGALLQWIETAEENLSDLGRGVKDAGRAFLAVAEAAERAGGASLDDFAGAMDRMADAAERPAFQNGLERTLRGAHQAMENLTDATDESFIRYLENMSHIMGENLPAAGETLGKVLDGVFDGLNDTGNLASMQDSMSRFNEAINRLVPVLPLVVDKMVDIADIASRIANNISKILTPAIEHLVPLFGDLTNALGPGVDALGSAVSGTVDAVGDISPAMLAAGVGMALMARRSSAVAGVFSKMGQDAKSAGRTLTSNVPTMRQFGQAAYSAGISMQTLSSRVQNGSKAVQLSSAQMMQSKAAVSQFGKNVASAAGQMGRFAGPAAGLAVAATGVAGSIGLTNTASLALMGTMGGPWGVAIGAAAGAVLDFGAAQTRAKESVQALSDTLDAQTGRATSATVATIIDSIGTDDINRLKEAGYSISDLRAAAENGGPSLQKMIDAMDDLSNGYGGTGWSKIGDLLGLEGVESSAGKVREELLKLADAQEAWKAKATDIQTVTSPTQQVAMAIRGLGDASTSSQQKVTDLQNALNGMFNPAIQAQQSAISLRSAIDQVAQSMGNGKYLTDQNKTALIQATTALQNYLVANADSMTPQQMAAAIRKQSDAIVSAGKAAGMSEQDIRSYLKTLGLTPESIETIIKTAGADKAKKDIEGVNKAGEKFDEGFFDAGMGTTGKGGVLGDFADAEKKADAWDKQNPKATMGAKGKSGVMKYVDDVIASAKGALENASGDAGPLGFDFGSGFANGIASAAVEVSAAAGGLVGIALKAVQVAQDSHSPSKKAAALGVDYVDGYALGIVKRGRMVIKTAAKDVVGNLNSAMKILNNTGASSTQLNGSFMAAWLDDAEDWLQRIQWNGDRAANAWSDAWEKATDKTSKERGEYEDARDAWEEARQKLRDADTKKERAKAAEELKAAKKKMDREKAQYKEAKRYQDRLKGNQKYYNAAAKAIEEMVEEYERVNAELSNAMSNLDSARSAMASYKEQLTSSYVSFASILNAPFATKSSIFGWMEDSLASLTKFREGMDDLMEIGIPQSVIDQLAQAGPEAQKFVDALLNMSPEEVKKFIEQWKKIEDVSTGIGNSVGDYTFADEIAKAQNAVQGLLLTLKDLQKPIADATNALMTAISKNTKVNVDDSLKYVKDLIAGYQDAIEAANELTTQLPGAYQPSTSSATFAAASAGAASSGSTTIQIDNISIPLEDIAQIKDIESFVDMLRVRTLQGGS